jgi:hypothetical protein
MEGLLIYLLFNGKAFLEFLSPLFNCKTLFFGGGGGGRDCRAMANSPPTYIDKASISAAQREKRLRKMKRGSNFGCVRRQANGRVQPDQERQQKSVVIFKKFSPRHKLWQQ